MMFIVYFNAFCSTDIDRGSMKYYFIHLDSFSLFQGIPGSIGPPGIAGQRGEKVRKFNSLMTKRFSKGLKRFLLLHLPIANNILHCNILISTG